MYNTKLIKKLSIQIIDIEESSPILKSVKTDFDNLLFTNKKHINNEVDIILIKFNNNPNELFNFIKEIKSNNSNQSIIIYANDCSKDDLLEIINLNINGFLLNPKEEDLNSKIKDEAIKYITKKNNIERRIVLENILDNQSGLILLTDFNSISYSSKSFLDFFNFQHHNDLFNLYENVLDIFIKHDNYLHANNKEEFLDKFNKLKALKKVVLLVGKNFTPKAFHVHIDKIKNSSKELHIISLTNISIMQEKNIEISHKAYTDGLTDVYNRNKFEETFEYEWERSKRYNNHLSIAILDIDHFKKFNDTYGHLVGDEILIKIAQAINSKVRKTDLFARWGGEEFVILMPETNIDEAKILCEKLRKVVEELDYQNTENVTCSFGITNIDKETTNLKNVFKRCDNALYNAKANGRNRVETL